jgi:hypothetical protein
MIYVICVPEKEGYEIDNGLLEMKRDINLKLVFYLLDDDNKIRQVFLFVLFFVYFTLMFLVVCSKLRIFYLEKAFPFCGDEK